MDNFCEFCHRPCEQSHCDDVCYQEHQDELRDWQAIRDERLSRLNPSCTEETMFKEVILETAVGQVKLTITEAKHMHVCANPMLNVSGKSIYFAVHLYDRGSVWSEFDEDGRSSIYATKAGTIDHATPTQKAKALAAILPKVEVYVADHPHVLQEAQAEHYVRQKERLQAQISEHEAKIAELRAEIEAL